MSHNSKLKVFLCHSKDDKSQVRELYQRLVADGFDAWLDEEKLMPGQDWDLEIRKAVRESDVVVVCLSNGSTTKAGYVQKEIRFALDVADEQPEGTIYLIPARLEKCEVPIRLGRWQWVDLFESYGNEKLKKALIARAKKTDNSLRGTFIPQLVQVPAGVFLMGSDDESLHKLHYELHGDILAREKPQRSLYLPAYSIGKYPITNSEYNHFLKDTHYRPPFKWDDHEYGIAMADYPVINVTWEDATAYCNWLSMKSGRNFRLPTEAEWEKAARGTDGRIFPWGNHFYGNYANTSDFTGLKTTRVGLFSPQGDSPYGCVDMVGNVFEWCSDQFYTNTSVKRSESMMGIERVIRGGSFNDYWRVARCAFRNKFDQSKGSNFIGFRVVN